MTILLTLQFDGPTQWPLRHLGGLLVEIIAIDALIALKKGSRLIKYSLKGKPKLRPFRISTHSMSDFEINESAHCCGRSWGRIHTWLLM
ncbi:uncharacterized protein [Malus domestica]|uniref:uncharacterized protein isoform X2 n=1 Tax=Malus domestica TaxID=3750 RepID=UPI00397630A7